MQSRGYGIEHEAGSKSLLSQNRDVSEELYRTPEGARRGGTRADIGITITSPKDPSVRMRLDINTIDTLRDGTTPTPREQRAADRMKPNRDATLQIPNLLTMGHTETVPKGPQADAGEWYDEIGQEHVKRIADNVEKIFRSR